jgi:short-subunit dehydrogenase
MSIVRSRKEQQEASTKSQALTGKVVIVSGASSGIGAVTAQELARRGAQVVLAARRVSELEAQVSAITAAGHLAVAIPTDVTDVAQVTRLVEQTLDMFGRVDVLVNNAGIAWSKPFEKLSMEQIAQIANVNLLGTLLLTRAVLPGMLERRRGSIISVASVAGHMPVDPLYSATKFGLRGFSLSLRRELAGRGVSVSVVSPGFVRTAMSRNFRIPMPGPEIVARTIADLILKPRREVIIPGYYHAIIGIEHLFPWVGDLAVRSARPRIETKK